MKHAIRSQRVVTPDGCRPALVIYEDGVILAVESHHTTPIDTPVHDAGNCAILPGLIDIHAHLNEPGRAHWEGFQTGARAAAAGGITALVDMPLNCIPSTTDVAALEQKRDAARGKSAVDYAFWGGVVPGNTAHLQPLADAGVRGFKCFLIHPGTDEFHMVTEQDLREAMPAIAETGLPLLVHAELPGPVAAAQSALDSQPAWPGYSTYLQSRPEESELQAIRLMIKLCREFHCPVHIVHLSAASALPDLRRAREEGLPITVETCPHYLYFSAGEIPDRATQFKCAPPIRDASNRHLLWEALRDGTIDCIATDHSPCPPGLKCLDTGDFKTAWGGISSLSVALPAMWTAARQRGFHLEHLAHWMSTAPAQIAGFEDRKGSIAPGMDADLVVFDSESEFVVTEDRLHFRHACSPYLGLKLRGEVKMTIVRGKVVYDRQSFATIPPGIELRLLATHLA